MTEKEKQESILVWKDGEYPAKTRDLDTCNSLCFQLNQTHPGEKEKRRALIKEIIGKIGERFLIESPFHCDFGVNVTIGENFYANHNVTILDCAQVTIGDNVLVGPNCVIAAVGHAIDQQQRDRGLSFAYPITIGNSVWLGASVTVLPGVTIGDNTIIGAGSVVSKDIPSGVIALGNPCKVVRKITQEDKDKYPGFENL